MDATHSLTSYFGSGSEISGDEGAPSSAQGTRQRLRGRRFGRVFCFLTSHSLESSGRRWLDTVMPSEEKLTESLERRPDSSGLLRPYGRGVVGDMARVLCSRDCDTYKKLFGLDALTSVDQTRVDTICTDLLYRGNRGGSGHANTNRSYWPRQLHFLEFLEDRPALQIDLKTFAEVARLDIDSASERFRWTSGKISFVTPAAVIAYLEHAIEIRHGTVSHLFSFFCRAIFQSVMRRWVLKTNSSQETSTRCWRASRQFNKASNHADELRPSRIT